MKEFIQLKISLKESNPLIWRQIILNKNTSFFELHHIIQITMGWDNYHMYEFNVEGYNIGETFEDEDELGKINSCNLTLKDIVKNKGEVINYEYDFGDGWNHSIEIEDFLDGDNNLMYPLCIAGELACPPEDCGGLRGFYYNLEILKDKKHPEYKETKMWMPRGYNPSKFDMEKVNKKLDKLFQYIMKWLKG